MLLKDLLIQQPPKVDLEAQRIQTAKFLAANKAKAASILLSAMRQLEANEASTSTQPKRIRI